VKGWKIPTTNYQIIALVFFVLGVVVVVLLLSGLFLTLFFGVLLGGVVGWCVFGGI
jgi:hypothetical protein